MGGGAAGTLTAARLLTEAVRQRRQVTVTVVERRPQLGQGVAFSARDPRHLLNVPAVKMSAFPEYGGHFLDWLQAARRPVDDYEFVPRSWYGEYLIDVLREAEERAVGSTLRRLKDDVVDLIPLAGRCRVVLDRSQPITADGVVLALGHLGIDTGWAPPALAASPRFVRNPWTAGNLEAVGESADVLLVGTGLTMIDALMVLDRPGRRVHAVSRHGAFPKPHADVLYDPMEAPEFSGPAPCLAELRQVMADHAAKSQRRYGDWRPAIDSIRAITQRLWAGLSPSDQAEFCALDARQWDALRHRIPPASAQAIGAIRDARRLSSYTGRVVDSASRTGGVSVVLSDETGSGHTTIEVGAVVNCTGPCDRPADSSDPLVRSLLRRGVVRPGPLGIGFDTTPDGRVVGDDGGSQLPVWTLGALRKGSLWESTAIPEIRDQAAGLGRCLLSHGGADYPTEMGSPIVRQAR